MKTQLYFLRHGESIANKQGIVQGQGLSFSLSEEGKKQAEIAAKKLKDFSFDKIFSSTALRAIETAETIKEYHSKTPYIKIAELNERSKGVAEGITKQEFKEKYPEIVKNWEQGINARPEGGESFKDVEGRVVPLVKKQISQDSLGSTFLYVTHGNIIRVLLGYMLQTPFSLRSCIKQDYCALNLVLYNHQRKRWEIEYINRNL